MYALKRIKNALESIKRRHDELHIIALAVQILVTLLIAYFAYTIQRQNYDLQRTLYDFEPQVSGFCNGVIFVYKNKFTTEANIEILINAPRSGKFILETNRFYPFPDYLDPDSLKLNNMVLKDAVRDSTYPQSYRYRGLVGLVAYIYPMENLTVVAFQAGALEFKITYFDVPKNTTYECFFNGTVRFEVEEAIH
jgi:hypothetical protein